MPAQKIKIVATSKHFLHLPIHFAKHHDWFGYLDGFKEDFEVALGEIGSETDVSDEAVIRKVNQGDAEIKFGICDPTYLVTNCNDCNDAHVLASIVTNSGIWAVSNGSASKDWSLQTLRRNYDTYISYGDNNTAHKIAKSLKGDSSVEEIPNNVKEVEFIMSRQSYSENNWVAITPNILGVYQSYKYGSDGAQLSILFPMGATHDLIGVLSSALIVHRPFADANKDFCLKLCSALQKALLKTISEEAEVVDFANKCFGDESLESRDRVAQALDEAVKARAFPTLISVSKGEWNAACRAHLEMEKDGGSDDDYDKIFTSYESKISPYVRDVKTAASEARTQYARTDWLGESIDLLTFFELYKKGEYRELAQRLLKKLPFAPNR